MKLARITLLACLVLTGAWADAPYADAVKQLATKIVAQLPAHSTVTLVLENRANLPIADMEGAGTLLQEQLRADGVELGDSDTKIRVTASEDAAHYLLISQNGQQIGIVSWPKPPSAPVQFRMALKQTPVWQQRDPILDVMLSADRTFMLVLEPDRVAQYTQSDGEWHLQRPMPIVLSRPMPRDARGHLEGNTTAFDVSAPGSPVKTPYPWVAGRNYFDGADRGKFFSAAETSGGTLLAGIDGNTRLYAQRSEPIVSIHNWGSDIAPISGTCGSNKQVLATAAVAEDAPDQLQAFEFAGTTYSAASEPLPLAGPVTALWPSESDDQVTVVVHDKQTGMYEASRVSLTCRQ